MPWPWGSGQRICQQRSDTQPPALTVKPLNQGVQLKLNASNFGNSSASKCIRVKRARWLVTLCEWGAPRVQTRRFDYKLNVACLNAICRCKLLCTFVHPQLTWAVCVVCIFYNATSCGILKCCTSYVARCSLLDVRSHCHMLISAVNAPYATATRGKWFNASW